MTSLQKLKPHDCTIMIEAKSGQEVVVPIVPPLQKLQQNLQLELEAHRRWNSSVSVSFLNSVDRIEINDSRIDENQVLQYTLEVFLSLPASRLPKSDLTSSLVHHATRPTFTVERSFTEFAELRKNVLRAVSNIPQCTCDYCMDFLVYIRYKLSQPRGLIKLTTGTNKRKQILTSFINDFVVMGQRRLKKRCVAQKLVPVMLEAFLLNNAFSC